MNPKDLKISRKSLLLNTPVKVGQEIPWPMQKHELRNAALAVQPSNQPEVRTLVTHIPERIWKGYQLYSKPSLYRIVFLFSPNLLFLRIDW